MVELVAFVPGSHEAILEELWTEYLSESTDDLKREFGFDEDIPAVVAETLAHLDDFAPPMGRLVLLVEDDAVLGCGGLRPSAPGAAEVKRMYVRPEARGRGLGRRLLADLLDAARIAGYREVRLDTDGLMPAAVLLYRSSGFVPCPPYPESDIPVEFHHRWLFMRCDLDETMATPISGIPT